MFERFTQPLKEVVSLAQNLAREQKVNYLGSEHLLLALVKAEQTLPAQLFANLGVTDSEIEKQIIRIVGQGTDESAERLPFTPRAKKCLEVALHEALALGYNYVGPEHLGLALFTESEGVTATILINLDLDRQELRKELFGLMDELPTEDTLRLGVGLSRRFERFSTQAKKAVIYSQEEAIGLKHNYVGTEHLLLGLLRTQDSLAARVLESSGVNLDKAKEEIIRRTGEGEEITTGSLPFTPRAEKVLELSIREALSLGHNYIGTEHIYLALWRLEGLAVTILESMGLNPEGERTKLISYMSGPPKAKVPSSPTEALLEEAIRDFERLKHQDFAQKYRDRLSKLKA